MVSRRAPAGERWPCAAAAGGSFVGAQGSGWSGCRGLGQSGARVPGSSFGSPGLPWSSPSLVRREQDEELLREYASERAAAQAEQGRLALEMEELRDQCSRQGYSISALSCRLAGAGATVAAELSRAAAVRQALGGELLSEEAECQALAQEWACEESELSRRVEDAEEQLAGAWGIRDSLEQQLVETSHVQSELRAQIAKERMSRRQLRNMGEVELRAAHVHKRMAEEERRRELGAEQLRTSQAYSLLMGQLQAERSAEGAWQDSTRREVTFLEQENDRLQREEEALGEELREARERNEARALAAARAAEEDAQEAEELRARLAQVDEECRQHEDATRRLLQSLEERTFERNEIEEALSGGARGGAARGAPRAAQEAAAVPRRRGAAGSGAAAAVPWPRAPGSQRPQ
ncbi:unnamed protein product, partial [Prorocentrum cordatum]